MPSAVIGEKKLLCKSKKLAVKRRNKIQSIPGDPFKVQVMGAKASRRDYPFTGNSDLINIPYFGTIRSAKK